MAQSRIITPVKSVWGRKVRVWRNLESLHLRSLCGEGRCEYDAISNHYTCKVCVGKGGASMAQSRIITPVKSVWGREVRLWHNLESFHL